MNTDKAEALARQDGTFQADKSEGVTTGVRDGDSQGPDARLIGGGEQSPSDNQVQNDGADDIETETDDLDEGDDEVIDPLDE